MKLRNIALTAALLASTLSSCIISSKGHTSHSGQFVSNETFEQIEVGRPQDYVLAILGEPTTKNPLEDEVEIWKWRYTESRSSSGHIIFLLNASNSKDRQYNTFVEFEDGLVSKAWRD
jgi:outer membrane protein assembly factor BamE (lipoprotein component of BamABCDE complex)